MPAQTRSSRTFRSLLKLSLALGLGTLGPALAATADGGQYKSLGIVPGKEGGTYTLALGDSPQTFNYYGAIDNNAYVLLNNVYEGLVQYDLATYQLKPGLASSWDLSKDGKVWTFHIRPGVKWSDGVPFTADDVVFSYNKIILNPQVKANQIPNMTFGGKVVQVTKVDSMTVKMTLAQPAGAFLQVMRTFIFPQHKFTDASVLNDAAKFNSFWGTDTKLSDVVGTGPFKFESYVPGQKVTLVKNTNYWKTDTKGQKLPYLDKLVYLIIRDPQQQVAQFLAGNVNEININGAQFPDLKQRQVSGAPFQVLRSPALFGSPPHLAFNFDVKDPTLQKIFRDLRFRQAMQLAINRKRVIEDVYNTIAVLPGHGVSPADKNWYVNTTALLGNFDLKAAAAKLDAMGLKMGPNGVRLMPNGKPLSFDLTYGTDSTIYPALTSILQNDLKSIGVQVNLKGIVVANLLSTGQSGNWQAMILAFGDQSDPQLRREIWQPGQALHYWHLSTRNADGTPNMAAMTDWEKQIYSIFDKAAVETDQAKRRALYGQWEKLFATDLPVIMIAKPDNAAAVSNKVGNFVYNLGPIPTYETNKFIYLK